MPVLMVLLVLLMLLVLLVLLLVLWLLLHLLLLILRLLLVLWLLLELLLWLLLILLLWLLLILRLLLVLWLLLVLLEMRLLLLPLHLVRYPSQWRLVSKARIGRWWRRRLGRRGRGRGHLAALLPLLRPVPPGACAYACARLLSATPVPLLFGSLACSLKWGGDWRRG